MNESARHPFSWQALARIVAMGVMVYLVWKAISVFVIVLLALVIAASLYPIAKKMSKKIPMVLSVIMVIILVLIPVAAMIAVTVLIFTKQFPQLVSVLTPLLERFHLAPDGLNSASLVQYMQDNFSQFLASTKQVALAITAVLSTMFLTFYFMFDADRLFALFLKLFPQKEEKHISGLFEEIANVMGQYIRGNLLISLICIGVTYGGLVLLKIPFALPIAIFAGIMDLLPLIGSVLGAIPAVILAFAISPIKGILVLVLYIAYKEAEDVIIGPAIYNKALNLSPALVFLSVVIGAGVFGVLGAFMALPVAASIPVILRFKEKFQNRHATSEDAK